MHKVKVRSNSLQTVFTDYWTVYQTFKLISFLLLFIHFPFGSSVFESTLNRCIIIKLHDFDYLEQIDRKLWMDFSGDPAAEGLVDWCSRCDGIQQLIHVVETKMTVLQQQPASLSHQVRYDAPGMHLLTLTHRDRTAS